MDKLIWNEKEIDVVGTVEEDGDITYEITAKKEKPKMRTYVLPQ